MGEEYFRILQSIESRGLGYRDFLYLEDMNIVICLLGDMNIVSRLDSYFTNYKMPWEKRESDQVIFSVGLMEIFKINDISNGVFTKMHSISFKVQVICLAFNQVLGLLAIGLDDGKVSFFNFDIEKNGRLTQEFEVKIHEKRVMSLAFDETRSILFSIGEDGFM